MICMSSRDLLGVFWVFWVSCGCLPGLPGVFWVSPVCALRVACVLRWLSISGQGVLRIMRLPVVYFFVFLEQELVHSEIFITFP